MTRKKLVLAISLICCTLNANAISVPSDANDVARVLNAEVEKVTEQVVYPAVVAMATSIAYKYWEEVIAGTSAKVEEIFYFRSYSKLRTALNNHRTSNGMPPIGPDDDCDAHHIVPKNDSRPGVAQYTEVARTAIKGCVDIDSHENGIFLPKKSGGKGCEGPDHHRTIHTKEYYKWVSNTLITARNNKGCKGITRALKDIKIDLYKGKFH